MRLKLLGIVTILLSFTFKIEDKECHYFKLDKLSFNKNEIVTGKVFFNTEIFRKIKSKSRGYGVFDINNDYNWTENSIQIGKLKKQEWDIDYSIIKNALKIQNDTAIVSFILPENIKPGKYSIKINQSWFVEGKDTIMSVKKIIEVN